LVVLVLTVTKRITIEIEFSLNLQERKELVNRFFPNISAVDYENNPLLKQLKYFVIFQGDEVVTNTYNQLEGRNSYSLFMIIYKTACSVSNSMEAL